MKVDRNNIDEYYKKVNDAIDHYFQYNISATSLQKYFQGKYGMDKFLKREGLEEIELIDRVVMDVIEDRVAKEESVLTFEEFSFDKKDFNISSTISMDIKKEIVDYYRISLGYLENIDNAGVVYNDLDNNHFKIESLKVNKVLYVLNKELIKSIKLTICDLYYSKLISNTLTLPFLNSTTSLDNKIDQEMFKGKVYMELKGTEVLEEVISFVSGKKYIFTKELDSGSLIFELEKSKEM